MQIIFTTLSQDVVSRQNKQYLRQHQPSPRDPEPHIGEESIKMLWIPNVDLDHPLGGLDPVLVHLKED